MRFVVICAIRVSIILTACAVISVTQINAQTQAAMNAEARADFQQADAELNKTYQALLTKLRDAESKQKLKEIQRAWIASRDAEAARAADEAGRGSMAPTIRYETMTHLTRERIKELKVELNEASSEKESASTAKPLASSSSTAEPPVSAPESEAEQARSVSETPEPAASSSPISTSPDKKWEFRVDGKGNPQIVRTGTTEAAVELYDKCGPGLGDCKPPLWAPDSKRFAMNAPEQGRYNPTSFYQLKGDKWEELDDGLNDALDQVFEKAIAAQMKKRGLRKKTELRLVSNPFKTINWLDSDTALVYGSKGEVVLGNADVGFAASYLFTIKFDEAGNWKIVKTQHLSEKESKKFEDDSHD
jgi:uncharacterized protein YecT (DUF1311 family)/predicted secreted protein